MVSAHLLRESDWEDDGIFHPSVLPPTKNSLAAELVAETSNTRTRE